MHFYMFSLYIDILSWFSNLILKASWQEDYSVGDGGIAGGSVNAPPD